MNFSECNYTDRDLITFLGQQESQDIRWGNEYENELLEHFRNGSVMTGSKMPWTETHDFIRFRPDEVTIHAGMNGHFKSMVTGQMMEWFALGGEPVGIMSFEMPVRDTQKRMCQQAAGSANPAPGFIKQWVKWNHMNLAYYDKLDTTPSTRVLGAVFYMAKDLGCKHILIDSLTKCGLPYGERGAEKDFIDALCATAKAFHIHIHLVCHVRKPSNHGQEYIPCKFDVRGAGELTDLVHNVIIHWNDKKKAKIKLKQSGGVRLNEKETEYLMRPDQRMIIEKQRNGAVEGAIHLEMHESLQFNKGRLLRFDMPPVDVN